jgi:hypothetical protein
MIGSVRIEMVILDIDLIAQLLPCLVFECGLFAPEKEWQSMQIIAMQLGLQIVVQPEAETLVPSYLRS